MSSAPTFADLILDAARAFERAGVEGARNDARRLMMAAEGVDAADLIARDTETPAIETIDRFNKMAQRRAAREPVSRILGKRAFWDLEFDLTPAVLDPRPDTETLVETALKSLPKERGGRVFDIGTGSGCILLALLNARPELRGVGVDNSQAAIKAARAHALRFGLAPRACFVVGEWLAPLSGHADVIVSNPPYIPTSDILALDPEVRLYDPHAALDGGPDGMAAYRTLAADASALLTPQGRLIVEVGVGQAGDVREIFMRAGWDDVSIAKDLSGVDRVVGGRWNEGE